MNTAIKKKGFTLVELIVVIGMLMLLAGAISSSVSGAQRRAKIQQATVEAQEMTKAILAYENYGKDFSLKSKTMENAPATEKSLAFILGGEKMQNSGQSGQIPVLFNAAVMRDGRILDPWGEPYYVTIRKDTVSQENNDRSLTIKSHVVIPNYNRRTADELKSN